MATARSPCVSSQPAGHLDARPGSPTIPARATASTKSATADGASWQRNLFPLAPRVAPSFVLMDTQQHALERFYRRGDTDAADWHQHVREVVERGGGQALLARMYDQLTAALAARPEATVLTSGAGAIGQAYQALTAALNTVP